MSVLTVTRAKISSNAFSTAREMVSFFNEELSKTLYNPDLSSSADETTVLLSQQNKKNAQYSKPEAIAMLKRHVIGEKQNSSFKEKFLQTGELGEFKNCLLVKTVLKEDGSMRVPMKIPQADLHALPEEVRRAVFAIKQMARPPVMNQRKSNGNSKKQPRNDDSANPSLNSSKKQKNSKKNPKGEGGQGGNQTPAADSTSSNPSMVDVIKEATSQVLLAIQPQLAQLQAGTVAASQGSVNLGGGASSSSSN
jgi:hypothetical protein